MHASLVTLLENLKPGLLWVASDGTVRYANADAIERSGLKTGKRLFDPDLLRAVAASVKDKTQRRVTALGTPGGLGKPPRELQCQVWPGLAADDAFVLIDPDSASHDGAGFSNLMQAIQADLTDPLRSVKKAWSQTQTSSAPPQAGELGSSMDELLVVLDRLVELSSLWSSSSLMANDRIELWGLLQKAWTRVEPQAKARDVRVRFLAQTDASQLAAIYGSEHWLGRVFQECLEAAVKAARPGASLDIEHRQLGPRALVVFRDSGVFAENVERPQGVEMPRSASSGGTRAPLQAQIGLKLCAHVVALHGGQLGEEEVDGLRHFLIELPTGGPPRSEDQQAMDIAQAQQYAKDLAALMSRSRRSAPAAAAAAALSQ